MWALLADEVVVDTTDVDPEGRFHADLMWQPCGAEVAVGWRLHDGEFMPPADSAAAPQWPTFSGKAKLDLFTPQEQFAIAAAAMTDPEIKVLYDRFMVSDFLTYEDPEMAAGLQKLLEKGHLSAEGMDVVIAKMQPR